jgi:hypothetical protein
LLPDGTAIDQGGSDASSFVAIWGRSGAKIRRFGAKIRRFGAE